MKNNFVEFLTVSAKKMMGQGAKMALPTCIIVHEKSSKLNYYHLMYFRDYCNTYISQHKDSHVCVSENTTPSAISVFSIHIYPKAKSKFTLRHRNGL